MYKVPKGIMCGNVQWPVGMYIAGSFRNSRFHLWGLDSWGLAGDQESLEFWQLPAPVRIIEYAATAVAAGMLRASITPLNPEP